MKNIAIVMICIFSLTGCATIQNNTSGIPEDTLILAEAGAVALGIYLTKESAFPDDEERGLIAIENANNYLLLMYGTGVMGVKPKYTLSSLLHSEILNRIVDPKIRRLAIVARLVINPKGGLTGISWTDALLMADEVLPIDNESITLE